VQEWEELTIAEEDRIWEEVDRRFDFRPSTRPEDWPGITELVPSRTYAIGHAYSDEWPMFGDDLNSKVLLALQQSTAVDEWINYLDWQHQCYRFLPHACWMDRDVIPNGDYAIFLATDYRFGIFGHPWEQTICIFGEPLLSRLLRLGPKLFTILLREDGKSANES
jgi:hypothetical protein